MEWKVYFDGDTEDINDFLKLLKENNISHQPSSNMLSYTWDETLKGRKAIALANEKRETIKIPLTTYKIQFVIAVIIPVSLFVLREIIDWWKEKSRKKTHIRMAIKTKHAYLDLKTTSPEDIEIIYNEEKGQT